MSLRKQHVLLLAVWSALTILEGCRQRVESVSTSLSKPTATHVRAQRRAFDGAPPVIPHEPLGAACVTCHTATGGRVPNLGYAPANPHSLTGSVQNCRQCHLFQRGEQPLVPTDFAGLPPSLRLGERLFPGAPPTIPHSLLMRENCLACHHGPSARPEIVCTHPERVNCRQCHVTSLAAAPEASSEFVYDGN